ncbi:hypothetical protein [Actinomadura violacea]|uniref:Uncharacterized protein n=1 Tax=Actinomadura violacea TaxID=2819934 RepID=A0ABS3RZW4_9ACTN|nr:hypothetical protein [Actinomadura violacea]MBO2461560.1 hypothetical protein [Actinomadura violacea]
MNLWSALAVPGLFVLVMGGTMFVTRVTEPYRCIPACIVVADARQFRTAERYIARLVASDADETLRMKFAITAMLHWLRYETRYGPKRRRLRRARQAEYWEIRLAEVNAAMGLPTRV